MSQPTVGAGFKPMTAQLNYLQTNRPTMPVHGTGSTTEVSQADIGQTFCFYAEDSAGRKAVASIRVTYPVITVEQRNDQLVATVGNAERDGLVINDNSWRWYRYHATEDSRFGCEAQNFDLDDSGLMQASQESQSRQEELFGKVKVDVYELQKDIYLTGQGSVVNLTDEDAGLSFCFQVLDTGGLGNLKKIKVGSVEASDNSVGAKEDGGSSDAAGSADGNAAGQVTVGASDDDMADNDPDNEGDGGSNAIRNVGLVLLALAVIIGIFMLVKRSQDTEDEEEV